MMMNSAKRKMMIGAYSVCEDEILGEGAFGEVLAGYTTTTGSKTSMMKLMPEKVAIKRLVKDKLSVTMREHLQVEVDVLKRCRGHPGVVQLRDIYETAEEAYFVMDYVNGGDLFDFVVERGRLQEKLARHIFGQLVDVVHHLHTRLAVIHHDIKLENVLLHRSSSSSSSTTSEEDDDMKLIARLTDFGLCCPVQRADDPLTKFSGTEAYCSPDLLLGRPYSGGANDVYCLGVLLYICVTGTYPFDSDDVELQVQQQTNYGYLSSLAFPRDVSRECRDLILTMLNPNMRKRLTIEQVAAHPFLAPYYADHKAKQEKEAAAAAASRLVSQLYCEEQLLVVEEEEEDELANIAEQQCFFEEEVLASPVNECEVSVADEESTTDDEDEDTDGDDANDHAAGDLSTMVMEDQCDCEEDGDDDDETMMMVA